MGTEVTFFEAVGGEQTFRRLVHRFYEGVMQDPLLRPMYDEDDLAGAEDRLALFLIQYWGGPNTYSEQRGHPRLRMRHSPFRIDTAAKDAWLTRMREAVDDLGLPPELDAMLWKYLAIAAGSLINAEDESSEGSPAGAETGGKAANGAAGQAPAH